jgi:hypothetical protein
MAQRFSLEIRWENVETDFSFTEEQALEFAHDSDGLKKQLSQAKPVFRLFLDHKIEVFQTSDFDELVQFMKDYFQEEDA